MSVGTGALERALAGAAPGVPVRTGADTAPWRVGGVAPRAVVAPGTPEEAGRILAAATREGWAVVPAGAGTWLDAGNPPSEVTVVLTTVRMKEVVEYEPANLTATVETGLGLGSLQGLARRRGQRVAADPPGDGRGTVGAALATASDGPLRLYHGALRDRVLGATVVTGDGRVLEAGGRVVKNVAGYDLTRLLVGSWGTLGLIVRASLRLDPLPEADATLLFAAPDLVGGVGLARRIATGEREPVALELLSPAAAEAAVAGLPEVPAPSWTVAARLEGSREAVDALAGELRELAPEGVVRLDGESGEAFWSGVAGGEEDVGFEARLAVLPARLEEGVREAMGLAEAVSGEGAGAGDGGGRDPAGPRIVAGAGTGSVRLLLPPSPDAVGDADALAGEVDGIRRRVEGIGGSLVLLVAPPEIVSRVGAWGEPGAAGRLMRALRERFDSAGVLTPERFAP